MAEGSALSYEAFLRAKIPLPGAGDLEGDGDLDASPWLKPHQNDAVADAIVGPKAGRIAAE